MSAASSNSGDRDLEALRRAQRAHEPSMEEILASIRSIIADDRENARAAQTRAQRSSPPSPGPQIVYSKTAAASPKPEPAKLEPVKLEPAFEALAVRVEPPHPEASAPKVIWSQPAADASVPVKDELPEAAAKIDRSVEVGPALAAPPSFARNDAPAATAPVAAAEVDADAPPAVEAAGPSVFAAAETEPRSAALGLSIGDSELRPEMAAQPGGAVEPSAELAADAPVSDGSIDLAGLPPAATEPWSVEPPLAVGESSDIRPRTARTETPLLSSATEAAVSSAFGALSETLAARSAAVADETIRELLRPMLKTWLDENLPAIVERLVGAEIERIAGGGQ